jgi:sialate O-acetylesterase
MQKIIIAALCLLAVSAQAQLKVHPLFTDHVVLQQNVAVPVWGTAAKGEKISIVFQGKTLTTTANAKGEWEIKLPATTAGATANLTITGKKEKVTLTDVVFGDVWLCSGQSNMEWAVNNSNHYEQEKAAATDAQIRHFKVDRGTNTVAQASIPAANWQVASPANVGNFTAVGYFFARELRKYQNIPIGLLNSSWGGTRIECWMSLQAHGYKTLDDAKSYHQAEEARRRADIANYHSDIPTEDIGIQNGKAVWAAIDADDSRWKTMQLPAWFAGEGKDNFDGVFWLRKSFELPASALVESSLNLGTFADATQVWINGFPLDTTSQPTYKLRKYTIPPSLLKAGKNVVTVRIYDAGGATNSWNDGNDVWIENASGKTSLREGWKYKMVKFQYLPNEQFNTAPVLIYNAMITPLHKFPIKGILWYQGESNAEAMPDAKNYQKQLASLATDWRQKWGQGNVPFLAVQLTSYGENTPKPSDNVWAVLRESQEKAIQSIPNAALAIIMDAGNPQDIHPRDKQTVGYRLSLAARERAYGEKINGISPSYERMAVEGNSIRLTFKTSGSQLMAKDRYGYLKGFAIAGEDRKFHWATARVEGNEVIVSCPAVAKPVAVRYAWESSPVDANLYTADGLQVGSFRTDSW